MNTVVYSVRRIFKISDVDPVSSDQRYKITDKMKGKAEFDQQKSFFFAGNNIFPDES